ncbi:MAG: NAD(P)/FAD-dependent oxidoreductase [Deltaproteobacteria bacterium]|nr:NAD(P)/FAD-dependent oxidoreductase [Deltaproteobacteria bacterium]
MRNPVHGKNIIVIGSGVGGLSAGILLALLEYHVTVVEKNREPGGLMRSYTRRGIDCPVGVHYVGGLDPSEPLGKMFRVLGIDAGSLFYRMSSRDVTDRYIFDDFVFDLPTGLDAYEKNLREACPADGAALDVLMKNLRGIAGQMLEPSFFLKQTDPFQNVDFFRPMGELLDDLGASARLRAILAVPCQLIGVPLTDCPVIFHHMVVAGYVFSAWRLQDGGAKMADAFAARFTGLGGKLILNASVQGINLAQGKVTGIRLTTGEDLAADGIVAAIHPKTMLGLLPQGALRASLRERILELAETDGVIAVQATVDAALHAPVEHNIYRLHVNEKGLVEDGIFYQIRKSNDPRTHLLSIITRSGYREWSPWENTLSGRRGGAYEEKKMALARDLTKKAEGIFGPLEHLRIVDVFTPLTLRDYMNCPEGACYGVLRSAGQLLKIASLNHLPIGGLCLAGQNAMAPGVLGSILGSMNAARQIAGDERFAGKFRALL